MSDIMREMFTIEIPMLEKILRTVIVYLAILLGLRLVGKRELGPWSPSDILVLFLIVNTVQDALIGDDVSLTGGLVGAATLFLLNHAIVRLTYHSRASRRLLEGTPSDLMKDGHVVAEALDRNQVSREELAAAARIQGIDNLSHVRHARIELDGRITFYRKEAHDADALMSRLIERLDRLEHRLDATGGPRSSAVAPSGAAPPQ